MKQILVGLVLLAVGCNCDHLSCLSGVLSVMYTTRSVEYDYLAGEWKTFDGAVGGALTLKECALPQQVRILYNGVQMQVTDWGGWRIYQGHMDGCDQPQFELPAAAIPNERNIWTLQVSDETTTWSMETDPLNGRSLTLRTPPGPLQEGDVLVFDWSHPGDTLQPWDSTLYMRDSTGRRPMGWWGQEWDKGEGSTIRFRLPQLSSGQHKMVARVSATAPIRSCTGLTGGCGVVIPAYLEFDLAVK